MDQDKIKMVIDVLIQIVNTTNEISTQKLAAEALAELVPTVETNATVAEQQVQPKVEPLSDLLERFRQDVERREHKKAEKAFKIIARYLGPTETSILNEAWLKVINYGPSQQPEVDICVQQLKPRASRIQVITQYKS